MYQRLQRLFHTAGANTNSSTTTTDPGAAFWRTYDAFARRKHDSFAVAQDGIRAAAEALETLLQEGPRGPLAFPGPMGAAGSSRGGAGGDMGAHRAAFEQVLHNALWGNQADLSVHTSFDGSGVRVLQVCPMWVCMCVWGKGVCALHETNMADCLLWHA